MRFVICHLWIIAALVVGVPLEWVVAEDYCDKTLCPPGIRHIACNSTQQFAANCPPDARIVEIDLQLRELVLQSFNEKRNFIAGGGDRRHKPACRMATMQWDEDLALLAQLNVKQCQMQHDDCRNTKRFRHAGQNLAWVTYRGQLNNGEKLKEAIKVWYDEVQHSNMKIIGSYPMSYSGPVISHFTAMMMDSNERIGCAASTYTRKGEEFGTFLVACNLAHTNIVGKAVYETCEKSAIHCSSGKNPKYPNLCTSDEIYSDVN